MDRTIRGGVVYFVGAGPGDPGLITVRGRALVAAAGVIVYADSLVHPGHAQYAKPGARVAGSSGLTLEEMTALMVDAARAGQVVVRLQSGDPSIYGAMHEQMAALDAAGVPYAVEPGVSSAFAAAAALGVELTVPEVAQTVIFTRAQGRASAVPEGEALRSLAAHGTTLVLFLSAAIIDGAVDDLIAGGYAPGTPAAIAHRVTWDDEVVVRCSLATVPKELRARKITKQALVLVGPALAPNGELEAARSRLYDGAYTHLFRKGNATMAKATPSALRRAQDERSSSAVAASAPSVVAASRPGWTLARRIAAALDTPWSDDAASPARAVAAAFRERRPLVAVGATGLWVRLIAPHLSDKHADPPVVVVDDAGRFAIALAGGHHGANALAQRVAAALGATPVVTTASDALGLPSPEAIAAERGWAIEATAEARRRVAAAIVNGDDVAVYQDCGDTTWRNALPPHIRLVDTPPMPGEAAAALLITDQALPEAGLWGDAAVTLRPRTLVAGVGASRGAPAGEIDALLAAAMAECGLAEASLALLATVDAKRDEPGLLAVAARRSVPLRCFAAGALARVPVPTPSAVVARHVDTPSVCEAAALLASGAGRLLVEKRRSAHATVAIARSIEGYA